MSPTQQLMSELLTESAKVVKASMKEAALGAAGDAVAEQEMRMILDAQGPGSFDSDTAALAQMACRERAGMSADEEAAHLAALEDFLEARSNASHVAMIFRELIRHAARPWWDQDREPRSDDSQTNKMLDHMNPLETTFCAATTELLARRFFDPVMSAEQASREGSAALLAISKTAREILDAFPLLASPLRDESAAGTKKTSASSTAAVAAASPNGALLLSSFLGETPPGVDDAQWQEFLQKADELMAAGQPRDLFHMVTPPGKKGVRGNWNLGRGGLRDPLWWS